MRVDERRYTSVESRATTFGASVQQICGRSAHADWVDDLPVICATVGFGAMGTHGDLGYEDGRVIVGGVDCPHALSAHAPSRLVFQLNKRYSVFTSRVALNDDIFGRDTVADFLVYVDGELKGIATNVRPGDCSTSITTDVSDGNVLELVVQTRKWHYCHAVWVNPVVIPVAHQQVKHTINDCLERVSIQVPPQSKRHRLCIATIGSPGYESWIDDLFGSICANAQCPTAQLVMLFFGASDEATRLADKYDAILIPCTPLGVVNMSVKAALYSISRVIQADHYICLDADILVLGELQSVVAAIKTSPLGSILCCREAMPANNLGDALKSVYHCTEAEGALLSPRTAEASYHLVVNDGVFAGSYAALNALDETIRSMTTAPQWVNEGVTYRNQFVFNLALAQLYCGVELNSRYNTQLNHQQVEFEDNDSGLSARANGQPVDVVHFNGRGRWIHESMRGRYRRIQDPLVGKGPGDSYAVYLAALRRWVGHRGVSRLAWSFYGTADGANASVPDSSMLPVLATLHDLIRSNGCSRVIETGTARGISASCIASAIWHRDDAKIVTIDISEWPERNALWELLPPDMRRCIEPRCADAITGLQTALANGERYHAALLDTVHTCEHVLQEFQLASQLVCEGGLILVHDPLLPPGLVDKALDVIASEGYGVVRLWAAKEGLHEENGLGLAIIENRKRS